MRYTEPEIAEALLNGTTSGAILYFGVASDTPVEYWEDEQDDAFSAMYDEAVAEGYAGSEDEYQADILERSGISTGLTVKGEVLRAMRKAKAEGTKRVWYGHVEHAEPVDIDEAITDIEQMDPDVMGDGTWGRVARRGYVTLCDALRQSTTSPAMRGVWWWKAVYQ